MQVALARITGVEPVMVWHKDTDFPAVDLIAVPGGFSYGDYLRSGAIASRSPVMAEVIRIPVAHHDGNYFAEGEILDRLEGEGQVAFRYCNVDGGAGNGANPNGSQRDIAGIYNAKKNVLGMMPHPERLIEPAQGGTDGRPMFEGLMRSIG